jgi:phosphoglycolate phosphatase-like HAD superfamily hydrolase
MTRPLVLFDIDGTLTLGDGLGTACYFSAFFEEFQLSAHSTDLTHFSESTDLGIASEIFVRAYGRGVLPEELSRLRRRYVESLQTALDSRPNSAYRPVAGAVRALGGELEDTGWGLSLATGNFREAAHLKLQSAGLRAPQRGAFGDDGGSRTAVLEAALLDWLEHDGSREVAAVYVGDRLWDAEAAAQVGIGFVGVASSELQAGAEGAGGTHVLNDLSDWSTLLAALQDQAKVWRR